MVEVTLHGKSPTAYIHLRMFASYSIACIARMSSYERVMLLYLALHFAAKAFGQTLFTSAVTRSCIADLEECGKGQSRRDRNGQEQHMMNEMPHSGLDPNRL